MRILTPLMMFGSVTKHTSGSVDILIATTVCTGTQKLQSMGGHLKTLDRFGLETQTRRQLLSHVDVLNKFWRVIGTCRGAIVTTR